MHESLHIPIYKRRNLYPYSPTTFICLKRDIIDIYSKKWMIETFKQLKQNFPLRYFYCESANAIKIQVWCTLIDNLLLMLVKCSVRKSWSFSGLATMIRIYISYEKLERYLNLVIIQQEMQKDVEAFNKLPFRYLSHTIYVFSFTQMQGLGLRRYRHYFKGFGTKQMRAF